ncbi:hypothetical protein [Leptospira bourretii]|nr:hypothetical protein [Leptospira bourretii]
MLTNGMGESGEEQCPEETECLRFTESTMGQVLWASVVSSATIEW